MEVVILYQSSDGNEEPAVAEMRSEEDDIVLISCDNSDSTENLAGRRGRTAPFSWAQSVANLHGWARGRRTAASSQPTVGPAS